MTLQGVAIAPFSDKEMSGFENMVWSAVRESTWLSRAKDVVFSILTRGNASPIMHTCYERVL